MHNTAHIDVTGIKPLRTLAARRDLDGLNIRCRGCDHLRHPSDFADDSDRKCRHCDGGNYNRREEAGLRRTPGYLTPRCAGCQESLADALRAHQWMDDGRMPWERTRCSC